MKPPIRQYAAFHLRSLVYKNFKKRFADSRDYQQWRFHRRKAQEQQFQAYLKWKQCQSWEVIQELTQGIAQPGRLELVALKLRSFFYRHFKGLLKNGRGYQRWRNFRNEPSAIQVAARLRERMIGKAALDSRILKGTADEARAIQLPNHEKPVVSILIPVYNKIEYTLTCLRSIQLHLPESSFEVIVIDDCSTDDTPQLLALVAGIRIMRNQSNQGFLRNCNNAAREARGEYLLFLNNDTEVQQGWMDELLWVFHTYPDAGLAGSKLIFPYGMLQEAGGIIWSDASGCNYGRESDPERPEFCYLREPDYCSGASLMIPAELFKTLGGFDERFSPAYYEDTDLAFAVRQYGRRVFFQPFSQVIHHEGISSGTDLTQGVKSYQLRNQVKFLDKWRAPLATHGVASPHIGSARERLVTKRALIIDVSTPTPDQDSGSVDAIYEIKILQTLGYKVTFIPDDLAHAGTYTDALQRMGVECQYQPYINSVKEHLEAAGATYDTAILKRVHYASRHIENIRRYCSKTKVIFNTVDLHFLREERQAIFEQSEAMMHQARKTRELEYSVMKQSDATIAISAAERDIISNEYPYLKVVAIPYVRDVTKYCPPFSSRRDIVFIGGFLHTPNVDAVLHFARDIWPLVQISLPDVKLRIVGSNASTEIEALGNIPGIAFEGYVPDLDSIFHRCRLSIAPLRFGAGIKGKIGTSLSYGVPCVASPLAVEGMHLKHQQEVMIAASPTDFAESIVKAYCDEVLWTRLSDNGIAYTLANYSFDRAVESYRALIDSIPINSKVTTQYSTTPLLS